MKRKLKKLTSLLKAPRSKFKFYIVHWGMIGTMIGAIVREIVIHNDLTLTAGFMIMMFLYMIRGYFWEEAYRDNWIKCEEKCGETVPST